MALKKKKSAKESATKSKKALAKKPLKKATKSAAEKPVKKTALSLRIKKKHQQQVTGAKKTNTKKISKKTVPKKPSSTTRIILSKPTLGGSPKKGIVKPSTGNVQAIKKATIKKSKVVAKKKPVITKKVVKPTSVKPKTQLPKPAKAVAPKLTFPAIIGTEKTVKIGVKTKKQLVAVAPQPVIEVSNYPKHKVKTILISQPQPETEKNPYLELAKKYNLIETFRQFIKIEGLPVKDFRAQRIDILEHRAVILTSKMAVDHYFRMCHEMRVTVPESMKYFCINESTAYYLQKYIQYRKRKIFFGHQTIQDLVDVIRKNKEEKFLLPAADVQREQICDFLDAISIKYTKAVMYRTVSANLSDIKNLNEFDVLVLFTPAGIRSLKQNFPHFRQGNTRIACFGAATANTLSKLGYRLDIYAPNPKNPSMSGALDEYIKEANKR